jgi:hypothetical protein
VPFVKLHRRSGPAEETRERLAIAVRHLRRTPQFDEACQCGAR